MAIEMFRSKIFDWSRTLSVLSNAWSQAKGYHLYAHNPKPAKLFLAKDRKAMRRIDFSREMAMAYTPRISQANR